LHRSAFAGRRLQLQSIYMTQRIGIIGGGITGLAAAHRLIELDTSADVTLLEASDRVGGVLRTERRDGFLIESSADNFITNVPWGVDLCRRVGLSDQLISTIPGQRRAMVVCRGKLQYIPDGFMLMAPSQIGPILKTPILSPLGKARLLAEPLVESRTERSDESLASFCRRRLGRETFERLIQPLISGIYTADPEKLSMMATMPRFVEMERQHGSLAAAMLTSKSRDGGDAASSGARYGLFVTLRDGMQSLVEAIVAKLPENTIHTDWPVDSIHRSGQQFDVRSAAGETGETLSFDRLIVATRAPKAAELLAGVDEPLAADLAKIPYAGCSVVVTGYRREQFAHHLEAFGVVAPAIEKRRVLAISFSSNKYAHRAPDDCVLVRVFIGGACQPLLNDLPDEQLKQITAEELGDLVGARGAPLFSEVKRWSGAMAQYHVGHPQLVDKIEQRAAGIAGLELAGGAYRGVGVPNCIHSGEQAAQRIAAV
jgi:oxygen-dependent protoporphyrinogen oxidase